MYVVATAGHVDHGKSALIRALTGRDPDRYAEEQRRGLTLDLGFAWTTLPSGRTMAFVDVPGHERFVSTMLAGVGPVPAVLFVVAADEGWAPQSEEHLAALHALGVGHGLLVVTKTDLADPEPVIRQARDHFTRTTLGDIRAVGVSTVTGVGLDELRTALDDLAAALPAPDTVAPIRLWIDRSFSIRGAGTVVTGTFGAGTLRVGDELLTVPGGRPVSIRGLESRERSETTLAPTSRAAVNLRGVERESLRRGDALVTSGAWTLTTEIDVLVPAGSRLPAEPVVHVGSASVAARLRPLGPGAARLRLSHVLPLHVADRLLLRDPGSRRVTPADVVDVTPQPMTRRGDAGRLAASLIQQPTATGAVRRRGAVRAADLQAAGYADTGPPGERVGSWWVDPEQLDRWRQAVAMQLSGLDATTAALGVSAVEVRQHAGIPDLALLDHLVDGEPRWERSDGRIRLASGEQPMPPGLAAIVSRLGRNPYDAPSADELDADPAELAHGVRTGVLLHLGRGVYVSPQAPASALTRLAELPQPFTMSEARQALDVSRRVGVPLLEHLDTIRRTRRVDDTHRIVVVPS